MTSADTITLQEAASLSSHRRGPVRPGAPNLYSPARVPIRHCDVFRCDSLPAIFRKDRGYPVFRRVGRRPTMLRRML